MNRGLALVWQAARGWTVAWGVLLLLQGLIPTAQPKFHSGHFSIELMSF
jgi:hypothetical protein